MNQVHVVSKPAHVPLPYGSLQKPRSHLPSSLEAPNLGSCAPRPLREGLEPLSPLSFLAATWLLPGCRNQQTPKDGSETMALCVCVQKSGSTPHRIRLSVTCLIFHRPASRLCRSQVDTTSGWGWLVGSCLGRPGSSVRSVWEKIPQVHLPAWTAPAGPSH